MGQTLSIVKVEPLEEQPLSVVSGSDQALSPAEEQQFQQWVKANQITDADSPESFYDYRAAFKAGAKRDASGHWPSDFKKPGHPNEIVGGFNTRTGERVPGTPRAKNAAELVRLGWDSATAERLAASPEPRTWGDTATDVAIGAVKGVGNTVYGLGKFMHDFTPVGRISEAIQPGAFDHKPPELEPTNTPQRLGHAAEQIGEFFIPTGVAGKFAKAAEIAKSGALSYVQSGSPVDAGISAGLTAVFPGAGAAKKVAGALEESAQKEMARALGATKEWAKVEAQKLAPQMLKRGVGGSRAAMLETAQATASRVGKELDDAYRLAAQAGETVPSDVIRGHLAIAHDALMTPDFMGAAKAIPGTEKVIRRLDKLDEFIASLGPEIPVDKAANLKRMWDHIVSKAGLFGPKAAATATDSADAWAFREASNAFRQVLNSNPTLAALNKESAFWTGLKKVLTETEKRTQAQSGGLVKAGMSGAGAVVGALSGDSAGDRATKAAIYGIAAQQLTALVQSPAFRTQVAGPAKKMLADALASGSTGQLLSVVRKITVSLPAQLRPQFAPQ